MAQSEWSKKLAFSDPNQACVKHAINGTEHKFWPMSIGLTFRLRPILKQLSKSIAVLTGDGKDGANVKREKTRVTGEQVTDMETEVIASAISPQLAQVRMDATGRTIEDAIESLMGPDSQETFYLIIMDSMRELFPKNNRPTMDAFYNGDGDNDAITMPVFLTMLGGVMKANKGVFGPLDRQAGALLKKAQEKLGVSESQSQDTQTQAGSTSKTDASSLSPEASIRARSTGAVSMSLTPSTSPTSATESATASTRA